MRVGARACVREGCEWGVSECECGGVCVREGCECEGVRFDVAIMDIILDFHLFRT